MTDQVKSLLEELFPDIDFASEELVDDGILDSLTITTIISELSLEFGITVPYEDIVAENFNSVEAMAAMVKRLQG